MNTKIMTALATASVLLASCLIIRGAEQSGSIEGRVTLAGSSPPETRINLGSNSQLEAEYPGGLFSRHYEVGEAGGLKNVLVYLHGDFRDRKFEPTKTSASLEHVKGLFQPYVFGIQAGQTLELRDTDRCNFHAIATANREFNYAFESVCQFTNAEVPVKFICDIHPWNYAYVGVFSHPFFTTTDKNGAFKIGGVPPGRYTIEIFHPKAGKTTKEVLVENQKIAKVDFSVRAK